MSSTTSIFFKLTSRLALFASHKSHQFLNRAFFSREIEDERNSERDYICRCCRPTVGCRRSFFQTRSHRTGSLAGCLHMISIQPIVMIYVFRQKDLEMKFDIDPGSFNSIPAERRFRKRGISIKIFPSFSSNDGDLDRCDRSLRLVRSPGISQFLHRLSQE